MNRSLVFSFFGRDVNAGATMRKLAGTSTASSSKISRAWDVAGRGLAKFGHVARDALIGVAGAGFAALAYTVKTGLSALSDYQSGLSQLKAGLRSTHDVSNVTAKSVESLASRIQSYAGQSRDAIVKTASLLITFTNVRNAVGKGNDVFTRATKLAADMAARLGGPASAQAMRLGKALNDPVKGLGLLSRVGVTFSGAQTKVITKLAQTGNVLGAQKKILAALDVKFAGSAKAYGNTLPGMFDRAKLAFTDFARSAVTTALPVLTRVAHDGIALFGQWRPQIADFLSSTLLPVFRAVGSTLMQYVEPTLHAVAKVTGNVLIPALHAVSNLLVGVVVPVWRKLAGFIVGSVFPAVEKIGKAIGSGLHDEISKVTSALKAHSAQFSQLWGWLSKVAGFILKILAPAIGAVLRLAFDILGRELALTITAFGYLIRGASAVGDFFRYTLPHAFGVFVDAVLTGVQYVLNAWFAFAGSFVHTASKAFGWLPFGVGGAIKSASSKFDELRGAVDSTLSGVANDAASWGARTADGYKAGFTSAWGSGISINTPTGKKIISAQTTKNERLAGITPMTSSPSHPAHHHKTKVTASTAPYTYTPAPIPASSGGGGGSTGSSLTKHAKTLTHISKRQAMSLARAMFDGFNSTSRHVFGQLSTGLQDRFTHLASKVQSGMAKLAAKVKTARDAVLATIKAKKSLAGSIRDALVGTVNLADIFTQDANGNSVMGNVGAYLAGQLASLKQFAAELSQLRHKGLSGALLQMVANLGPGQGIQVATQILSGGAGSISSLNATESGIEKAGQSAGNSVADAIYAKTLDRENKHLAALEASSRRSEKLLKGIIEAVLATATTPDALRKALLKLKKDLGGNLGLA